jgi:hypothetical protein
MIPADQMFGRAGIPLDPDTHGEAPAAGEADLDVVPRGAPGSAPATDSPAPDWRITYNHGATVKAMIKLSN